MTTESVIRVPLTDHKAIARDYGLLALRSAGLFLCATFGLQKVVGGANTLLSGHALSQWGLATFVRDLGFPFPTVLAVCATLNEFVVSAAVAVGWLTRIAAACLALNMAVDFYISLRLPEEPLRAALYGLLFATLAITGPGSVSVDAALSTRRLRSPRTQTGVCH